MSPEEPFSHDAGAVFFGALSRRRLGVAGRPPPPPTAPGSFVARGSDTLSPWGNRAESIDPSEVAVTEQSCLAVNLQMCPEVVLEKRNKEQSDMNLHELKK